MLEKFNAFYKFGTIIKQKAALYTLAIVFTISICNFLMGTDTVQILHLLEAFVISFIGALIEYAFFHDYENLTPSRRRQYTFIWFILLNVLAIGSANLFNWYVGVPMWGIALLLFILESGLLALRYSIYVINALDTKVLNEDLKHFQNN